MRVLKYFLIVICLLVFVIFLAVLYADRVNLFVKKITQKKIVYTFIGDSISSGYALPGYQKDGEAVKDTFTYKFAEKINAGKVNNLAVSGEKTKDLLENLKEENYRKSIEEADVITVSIGSNDCLSPGLKILYSSVNASNEKDIVKRIKALKKDKIKLFLLLDTMTKSITTKEAKKKLSDVVDGYKANFTKIIEEIEKLNGKAFIIVENYYNPYKDFVYDKQGVRLIEFGDSIQGYIDEMNNFLENNKYCNRKYYISDISSLDTGKTNVKIDFEGEDFCVDPHPNTEGHDFIFNRTLSVYKSKRGLSF